MNDDMHEQHVCCVISLRPRRLEYVSEAMRQYIYLRK